MPSEGEATLIMPHSSVDVDCPRRRRCQRLCRRRQRAERECKAKERASTERKRKSAAFATAAVAAAIAV